MVKALVAGPLGDYIFKWLLDGFGLYDREIRARVGMSLTYVDCIDFADFDQAIDEHQPDLLFFAFHWATPVDQVVEYLKRLNAQPACPKLVYLDYYDQSSTPFFPILPHVDRYWKKQLLKPLARYNNSHWVGGNPLAEMARSIHGVDIGDWSFGSEIPDGFEDRIELSWNVASHRSISQFARYRLLNLLNRRSKKSIDVFCRVSTGNSPGTAANDIYMLHRTHCLKAVGRLEKRFRIESNHDGSQVPYKEFKRQLSSARIALSPWGWGEITDRDFRIVNAGALLMKPDMSHLQTDPDIFIAGETYAPVAWDLADLEEQCDYYLSRPREIRRIAANAYEAYRGFFKNQIIVRKLEALIEALWLPPSLRAQDRPAVDPNDPAHQQWTPS